MGEKPLSGMCSAAPTIDTCMTLAIKCFRSSWLSSSLGRFQLQHRNDIPSLPSTKQTYVILLSSHMPKYGLLALGIFLSLLQSTALGEALSTRNAAAIRYSIG
jgi:hypothetical protein